MDMKNKLLNLLEEPCVLQWLASNPSCSWKSFSCTLSLLGLQWMCMKASEIHPYPLCYCKIPVGSPRGPCSGDLLLLPEPLVWAKKCQEDLLKGSAVGLYVLQMDPRGTTC